MQSQQRIVYSYFAHWLLDSFQAHKLDMRTAAADSDRSLEGRHSMPAVHYYLRIVQEGTRSIAIVRFVN